MITGLGYAGFGSSALEDWRRQLGEALAGVYNHPLPPALHATLTRFAIPRDYLDAVLDGVGMDLDTVRYATFGDLYPYCYRVASAVGLACIHIWGFDRPEAKDYAEAAGIAFQLTNILRDLAEDAGRGRVYLPREDLERFGYGEEQLLRGERDDAFRRLMQFEVARARSYYDAARPLIPDSSTTSASMVGLPRESRISRAMTSTIALMFLGSVRVWTNS